MARRKRNDFQREADFVTIAQMYKEGKLQIEIAKELGLSQGQISQDLAEVLRRWRAEAADTIDAIKQRELDKINNLEIEYWHAWELSLKDATGVSVETKTVALKMPADGGDPVELPAAETKTTKRRQGQSGNPAYLAGVQWCIDRRCKLLGLDAPTKSELTGKDGGPIQTEATTKPDLSKLGIDELLQLRQIMTKATDGTTDAG